MRLLLDTHVLLWWLADDPRLSASHRTLLADVGNTAFVSSVSIAEISLKASLGKLEAPSGVADEAIRGGFEILDFSAVHAEELRALPWHHRDPFDRMLIAQARVERLAVLSVDRRVRDYDVPVQ